MSILTRVRDAQPRFWAPSAARTNVRLPRLLIALLPMAMAMYGTFQGGQFVLLPAQVERIDPAGKIFDLSFIVVITAITGVLGITAGGTLSDLTETRWGRRAPWLLAMGMVSTVLFTAMGHANSLFGLAVLTGTVWFTLNFFQAVCLCIIPDRISESRRAIASSIFAFASPIGTLYGMNVAGLAPNVRGFTVLAVMVTLTAVMYVALAPEASSLGLRRPKAERPPGPKGFARVPDFFEGFRDRDFAFAFVFRVLMSVGQSTVFNFLLYILHDHIGLGAIPGHSAEIASGDLSTTRMLSTIAAIMAGLWIARRTSRKLPFARIYAVAMAAAMLVPVVWPTWNGMLIFAALGGLAIGTYSTIDIALITMVLPNKEKTGRDLSLLVMAGATAQLVAPMLGGAMIHYVSYDALFVVSALLTLAAGGATFWIKGVR